MAKFTVISLGPGDPKLLTLSALEALQECHALCIPTRSKGSFERSRAFSIIRGATRGRPLAAVCVPLFSPMQNEEESWQEQADLIVSTLGTHESVGYPTLGDAAVYSTAYRLLHRVKRQLPDLAVEVIPGVTSFSRASALVHKPLCLGEQSLLVRPCFPRGDLVQSTVWLRPERGVSLSSLPTQGERFLFERLGMEGERIVQGAEGEFEEYLSLVVDFAP